MNLPGIQVLAFLFSCAMAYATYTAYRKHQFGRGSLALWEAIWTLLGTSSIFPGAFAPIASSLRLARLMDLVVVVGMIVLGAIVFQMYLAVAAMQRKLEALVRARTLEVMEEELEREPVVRTARPRARRAQPSASSGTARASSIRGTIV